MEGKGKKPCLGSVVRRVRCGCPLGRVASRFYAQFNIRTGRGPKIEASVVAKMDVTDWQGGVRSSLTD
jgi:hypothetical protein